MFSLLVYNYIMPEKHKSSSNYDDDQERLGFETAIEAERRIQLAEHIARIRMFEDEKQRKTLKHRKAVDQATEIQARIEAQQIERESALRQQEKKRTTYPWGVQYLNNPSTIDELKKRGRSQQKHREVEDLTKSEQKAKLPEEYLKARRITLRLAKDVADRLKEKNVPEDTLVSIRSSKEDTKKTIFGKTKPTGKAPKHSFESLSSGWIMPIRGQVDQVCSVILNNDGKIITAYGELVKSPVQDDPPPYAKHPLPINVLNIKKDRIGEVVESTRIRKKPPPVKLPDRSYHSFVTEELNSDMGAANRPVNSPIAEANLFFDRETSMQAALLEMLEDRKITWEEPTPGIEARKNPGLPKTT